MARSDNQNLQIFLIVFVILTLLLAVTTFMFFSSYREASTALKAAGEQAAKDAQQARQMQTEMNKLMQLVGFAPETKVSDVEAKLGNTEAPGEDRKNLMAGLLPDRQTYRGALEQIVLDSMRETLNDLGEEKVKVAAMTETSNSRETVTANQVKKFEEELAAAKDDLATEQVKFKDERDRLNKEKDALAGRNQEIEAELTKLQQDNSKAIAELETSQQTLASRNTELTDQIRGLTNETFEVADGLIRQVNQRSHVVWINLGERDGLQRQTTFSVYGQEANDVARQRAKAKIEVTQIRDTMAEARILEDDPRDPITPGDMVYTPLWHPGRTERFALAGFMDVDGDGETDREMIHDLIGSAGGEIVAEVMDDGKVTGQMTTQTRYLVLGDVEKEGLTQGVSDLRTEARTLGVEEITLEKLLDHVGWTKSTQVVRYGKTSPHEFGRPRPDGGIPHSTGNVTELYRRPKMPKIEKPAADDVDGAKKASEPEPAKP